MKVQVVFEVSGEIDAESYEDARQLARGMCGSLTRAAERQGLEMAGATLAATMVGAPPLTILGGKGS